MCAAIDDKGRFAAVVLMERMLRDVYPSRHSSEIQPLQWSILRYLQRMPEERRELRWIARFIGVTGAPVTRALQTLELRGLVSQRVSTADSRTKTVSLTPSGVEIMASDPILAIAGQIRSWPAEHQEIFVKSIRSLALGTKHFEDDDAGTHSSG